MSALFHSLIYQPIYNFLVLLYQIIPGSDFGIAIIVTTIALKSLLYPLSQKQIESQKKLQEIQPKIKEIQKKYKGDREKQSRAVMEFYRENKVNPFSGCLPLIIQLVILIAIYQVLFSISNSGFVASSEVLYSFISNPGNIHQLFLGILDLSKPSTILAVATALAQYYQMKMTMGQQEKKKARERVESSDAKNDQDQKEPDFNQIMMQQMLYIGPALTLFFGMTFPSGLALYWFVSTLFAIGQQRHVFGRENAHSSKKSPLEKLSA